MASSTQYSGLSGDKPSSRVLRPPGGASSNIFGGSDESSNNNLAKDTRSQGDAYKTRMQTSNVFGEATESPKAPAKPEHEETVPDKKESDEETEEDQETKVKPKATNPITGETEAPREATKRVGTNPITGEAYNQSEKTVHTSTKVRQPPGGASSGIF